MPPATAQTGIRANGGKGARQKTVFRGSRTPDFSSLSLSFSTGSVKPSLSGDALSEQASAALKSITPKTKAHPHTTDHTSVVGSTRALKLNLAVFKYSTWLDENQLRRAGSWVAIGIAVLVRWTVSLGPYSGMNSPPRYGDYEAQRHWMELTLHRPAREWYSDNSKWWDLDYPPLTAYVSLICAYIGDMINPEWFAWESSRGYESVEAKLYMRSTVLLLELAVYLTSILAFTSRWFSNQHWTRQHAALILILMQPGLILIDSGHFQYNTLMLGLAVWSVNCFLDDQDVLGSIFFCLALGFKQMALYFSPAIFAYLLGKSIRKGFFGCIWKLAKLGSTVVVTFGLLFAPWTQTFPEILQVLHRIFPVFRGLYQDKVANVWCAVNVVVKLRELFDIQQLVRFSTAATMLAFLPSTFMLLARPTKRSLIYGMVNTSLSFFLLSFQVHEKSILIPALPVTLLILDEPAVASLFITSATFSMFPLLKQEGLAMPYFVLAGFWIWLTAGTFKGTSPLFSGLAIANIFVIFSMHVAEFMIPFPLAKYPDIYPVLNALWSAGCFVTFWGYYNYRQYCQLHQ